MRGPGRLHYLTFFPRSIKRGRVCPVQSERFPHCPNPSRPGTLTRPLLGPSPSAHFLTCPAWGPHGGHDAEERPRADQTLGPAWLRASPVALPPLPSGLLFQEAEGDEPPVPGRPWAPVSSPCVCVCVCVPRVHMPYVRANKPVCVCSWNAHAGRNLEFHLVLFVS